VPGIGQIGIDVIEVAFRVAAVRGNAERIGTAESPPSSSILPPCSPACQFVYTIEQSNRGSMCET
jgi:hypothetical protein